MGAGKTGLRQGDNLNYSSQYRRDLVFGLGMRKAFYNPIIH
jgi:hypothetical protein